MVNIDYLKSLLPKFIQYFFVGLFAALVNWGVFYILDAKLKMFYLIAATVSWTVGLAVNFILSCIVFKSKEGRKRGTEFVMVVICAIIGFGIDLGVTVFCVAVLGFPNMVSKITGTGAAFMFNYASRQFFVFSHIHMGR
jgi:putative flippase GtrA